MKIRFNNKGLEGTLIGVNAIAAIITVFTFVALFGFKKPLIDTSILYIIQILLFCFFIFEKVIRVFNAAEKKDFIKANWLQIPLLLIFIAIIFTANKFFKDNATYTMHLAVGIYIFLQVVEKVCRTGINLAASGKNPTRALIASFVVLIISGAGLLMLPMSSSGEQIGFTDAVFTATSATCVTGLVVKDTGKDFSLVGQIVILSLIQLGGLGIVIFGAVIALLLGQALSISESVAMQDILNERTLGSISKIIAFIFITTLLIETIGTLALFRMWDNVPGNSAFAHGQWFCSIFHSISAFCNAGFGLFSNSLINYSCSFEVYTVICPLIIIGGLGFGVLFDLFGIAFYKIKRLFQTRLGTKDQFFTESPKMMRLQTKIVLTASATLIAVGTIFIMLFSKYTGNGNIGFLGAFFQSVTARTAGFNTVDIGAMSEVNRLILMVLMFIGGSPGSTAGGIKTVTLVVIIMTVIAAMRKRPDVEIFRRSVRMIIVRRAITVAMFFVVVLFVMTLALSITERHNDFTLSQIAFEATSALATVGLTTGITPFLSVAGKFIIIATMLIGRLGPLTLVAALTFNLKPIQYNYPDETLIVG